MSRGLLIRHVTAGESDQLRRLRLLSLASDPGAFGSTHTHELAHTKERWEQWAAESEQGSTQRTFVAMLDYEDWQAMALVRLEHEMPGVAALYGMWVAPEARGHGVAGKLCECCAVWASERGCRELRLFVEATNDAAQRAYMAAGFEPTGQDSWTRPDGVIQIHIIMTRFLPADAATLMAGG